MTPFPSTDGDTFLREAAARFGEAGQCCVDQRQTAHAANKHQSDQDRLREDPQRGGQPQGKTYGAHGGGRFKQAGGQGNPSTALITNPPVRNRIRYMEQMVAALATVLISMRRPK